MLVGTTRAILAAVVLAGGTFAACATSPMTSTGQLSAGPTCPASFGDVATASCTVQGQTCTYLVSCPAFPSNAVCTCSGGSFTCSGFGDAGTACVELTTTGKCPGSERSANGLFCSDPGLICTYPSPCKGIPTFDQCQCVGGTTPDDQAHYECTSPCEMDAAPMTSVPDASGPDAVSPVDANAPADSPSDAPSSVDGANDL
jgi:hypothetical protein